MLQIRKLNFAYGDLMTLPNAGEAEIRMRGDDVFGRHLCVGFRRPLTPEEADCEGRYAGEGLRAAA